jgi:hypothetical protein
MPTRAINFFLLHGPMNGVGLDLRRVEDPTDGVVDCLRLGKRLVTALVGDDPETSGEETGPEGIERPEGETCDGIEERMGQGQRGRVDERVQVLSQPVEAVDDRHVPDAVNSRSLAPL